MADSESSIPSAHPQSENVRSAAYSGAAFQESALAWLESRKPFISERTYLDYTNYIGTLGKIFREMRINEIDADQLRAYQQTRSKRAGGSLINKEVGIIVQMRKRLGTWAELSRDYERLPEL